MDGWLGGGKEARVPRVSEYVSAAVRGGTEGPGPVTCARSLRRRRRRRGRAALQSPAPDHQRRAPSPSPPGSARQRSPCARERGGACGTCGRTAAGKERASGDARPPPPRRGSAAAGGPALPAAARPPRPAPRPAPPCRAELSRAELSRAVPGRARSSALPKLWLRPQPCGHGPDTGAAARPLAAEEKGAGKPTGNFSRAVQAGAVSADCSFRGMFASAPGQPPTGAPGHRGPTRPEEE